MASPSSSRASRCCSTERRRLVDELRACDCSSTSYEEHSRCYQEAAYASGQRSKHCILAA
jgi:hypothetical protein